VTTVCGENVEVANIISERDNRPVAGFLSILEHVLVHGLSSLMYCFKANSRVGDLFTLVYSTNGRGDMNTRLNLEWQAPPTTHTYLHTTHTLTTPGLALLFMDYHSLKMIIALPYSLTSRGIDYEPRGVLS